MSKRSYTTIAIQVRFRLPPGANTAMALAWFRDAVIGTQRVTPKQLPMSALEVNELIVKLTKKETVYL